MFACDQARNSMRLTVPGWPRGAIPSPRGPGRIAALTATADTVRTMTKTFLVVLVGAALSGLLLTAGAQPAAAATTSTRTSVLDAHDDQIDVTEPGVGVTGEAGDIYAVTVRRTAHATRVVTTFNRLTWHSSDRFATSVASRARVVRVIVTNDTDDGRLQTRVRGARAGVACAATGRVDRVAATFTVVVPDRCLGTRGVTRARSSIHTSPSRYTLIDATGWSTPVTHR